MPRCLSPVDNRIDIEVHASQHARLRSALDARTREIMQTELMRMWEERRKTMLFVTHQIDEAVFLSDRVLVLGRRPRRIQETVAIALPRPRALAIKRTAEFVAYVDRIWRLIEDDVRASVIEEHA